MNINATQSAVGLIHSAQQKATDAAHKIATLPVSKDEAGSSEFNSTELFPPILQLKEAEHETSAGVKILQTQDKMIGSLLDIKA